MRVAPWDLAAIPGPPGWYWDHWIRIVQSISLEAAPADQQMADFFASGIDIE